MKLVSIVTLLALFKPTNSFQAVQGSGSKSFSTTQLQMSYGDVQNRRQAFSRVAATFLTTGVLSTIVSPQVAVAGSRPEYLTEPTDEFKESERQRAEFRAVQLQIKKKFVDNLERITKTAKTEDELRIALEDLKNLITESAGLPLGIKKDDIVKQVRSRKAQGFWPTSVEYAYQAVIREIAYQQSPNKDKDIANPL